MLHKASLETGRFFCARGRGSWGLGVEESWGVGVSHSHTCVYLIIGLLDGEKDG